MGPILTLAVKGVVINVKMSVRGLFHDVMVLMTWLNGF